MEFLFHGVSQTASSLIISIIYTPPPFHLFFEHVTSVRYVFSKFLEELEDSEGRGFPE